MGRSALLAPELAERLDALFRRHHRRILGLAKARTRDAHAAEDVAGETWARAAEWIHTLKADDEHAYAWLAAIARRAATDYYRPKVSQERPMDWADDLTSMSLPSTEAAEDVVLAEPEPELSPAALAAVGQLPAGPRAAVRLRCDGLSYPAIGSRIGRDSKAAWRYVHQAAAALRPAFAKAR